MKPRVRFTRSVSGHAAFATQKDFVEKAAPFWLRPQL